MSDKDGEWRILRCGEIIQAGDEVDACVDPWHGLPSWKLATEQIGKAAPDPAYPAHTLFRRRVAEATHMPSKNTQTELLQQLTHWHEYRKQHECWCDLEVNHICETCHELELLQRAIDVIREKVES